MKCEICNIELAKDGGLIGCQHENCPHKITLEKPRPFNPTPEYGYGVTSEIIKFFDAQKQIKMKKIKVFRSRFSESQTDIVCDFIQWVGSNQTVFLVCSDVEEGLFCQDFTATIIS